MDEYIGLLEKHLEANGFSSNTDVLEYSAWGSFVAWAKGNPHASVAIRDFFASGDVLDKGVLGFASLGSNEALVYGKGIYFGSKYNPSTIDLVNVTTHELGHAIFFFQHIESGIMYKYYSTGSSLINYTYDQRTFISNSVWGQ